MAAPTTAALRELHPDLRGRARGARSSRRRWASTTEPRARGELPPGANLLGWAMHFFILAFVLVAVSWLLPEQVARARRLGAHAACTVARGDRLTWHLDPLHPPRAPAGDDALRDGHLHRRVRRSSPASSPSSITRKRIALALAPLLGRACCSSSPERYELVKAEDTMPQLRGRARHQLLARHPRDLHHDRLRGEPRSPAFSRTSTCSARCSASGRATRSFYATLGRMVYGVARLRAPLLRRRHDPRRHLGQRLAGAASGAGTRRRTAR